MGIKIHPPSSGQPPYCKPEKGIKMSQLNDHRQIQPPVDMVVGAQSSIEQLKTCHWAAEVYTPHSMHAHTHSTTEITLYLGTNCIAFRLVHVPSANMEQEGFMIYSATSSCEGVQNITGLSLQEPPSFCMQPMVHTSICSQFSK